MLLEQYMDLSKNKKVVLSLFSKNAPNGKPCAKNYPLIYAEKLTALLREKGYYTIQIGVPEEPNIGADVRLDKKPLEFLIELSKIADYWISVDSFWPHLMKYYYPEKRGIVIFSKSDPKIFGYSHNINMLKSRSFLRQEEEQFVHWNDVLLEIESFVTPRDVYSQLLTLRK
jgi:ADP-heptose:LPS heptosyltransferase